MSAIATRTRPDIEPRIAEAMERIRSAATAHAAILATHERGSDAEQAAADRWDAEIRACAALLREAKARRAGR